MCLYEKWKVNVNQIGCVYSVYTSDKICVWIQKDMPKIWMNLIRNVQMLNLSIVWLIMNKWNKK